MQIKAFFGRGSGLLFIFPLPMALFLKVMGEVGCILQIVWRAVLHNPGLTGRHLLSCRRTEGVLSTRVWHL